MNKIFLILISCILVFIDSCFTDRHLIWSQSVSKQSEPIRISLLAINDFHGQLTFGNRTPKGVAGSAPVFDAYIKKAVLKNRNTFFIEAGDLVGASTTASALLKDEPTIEFFNHICSSYFRNDKHFTKSSFNFIGVPGNHEFDAGSAELDRLFNGDSHKNGKNAKTKWNGAFFPLIAANIYNRHNGKLMFPPYIIKNVNGVKIAFIGATFSGTKSIVKNPDVDKLYFADEAISINRYIPDLKSKGIRAIVAIIHNGANPPAGQNLPDSLIKLSGPIVPILEKLDNEIDVVITAHTHTSTNMIYKTSKGSSFLITQAYSKGMGYADITLEINRESGEVINKQAEIVMAYSNKEIEQYIDPEVVKFTNAINSKASLAISREIGNVKHEISKDQNSAGESPLGNLVADAYRNVMDCDFALVNINSLRSNLLSGPVTWSRLYYMQPNNNHIVKLTLSGQELFDVLNQQWINHRRHPCILQISGFNYIWDPFTVDSNKVVEILKDGKPIDRQQKYTVATTSFLAEGGDKFTVLSRCKDRVSGPQDLLALEKYISGLPNPITAVTEERISNTIYLSGT